MNQSQPPPLTDAAPAAPALAAPPRDSFVTAMCVFLCCPSPFLASGPSARPRLQRLLLLHSTFSVLTQPASLAFRHPMLLYSALQACNTVVNCGSLCMRVGYRAAAQIGLRNRRGMVQRTLPEGCRNVRQTPGVWAGLAQLNEMKMWLGCGLAGRRGGWGSMHAVQYAQQGTEQKLPFSRVSTNAGCAGKEAPVAARARQHCRLT